MQAKIQFTSPLESAILKSKLNDCYDLKPVIKPLNNKLFAINLTFKITTSKRFMGCTENNMKTDAA